jgi:hypothetical protein
MIVILTFVILIFSVFLAYVLLEMVYNIFFHNEGFEITYARIYYNETNRSIHGYVYLNNTGNYPYYNCGVGLIETPLGEGYIGPPPHCDYYVKLNEKNVIPAGQQAVFSFDELDPESDKICLILYTKLPLDIEGMHKIKTISVSCRIDQPRIFDYMQMLNSATPTRSYLKNIDIEIVK